MPVTDSNRASSSIPRRGSVIPAAQEIAGDKDGNRPRYQPLAWRRMCYDNTPIYLSVNEPNWFVPNTAGDRFLCGLARGIAPECNYSALKFLSRLPANGPFEYAGRGTELELERIGELWFHLTNRCNMACSHCLFSCSAACHSELPAVRLLAMAGEAYEQGCRLFALTGGEPLVYPRIEEIIRRLLDFQESHVAVLTNGLALIPLLDRLRPDPRYFHCQISLDGLGETHDRLRGRGSFQKLSKTLRDLKLRQMPYTLSMCVTAHNVQEMAQLIDFAEEMGAGNVHFMWYFARGRGKRENFAPVETIFTNLRKAADRAQVHNISIDNIEALKTQIFAPAGTIHDGCAAAWESLAIGPDGLLYPSAALVGTPELAVGLDRGLKHAWRHSPILRTIRQSSAITLHSPFRFLLGGGDIDHSYIHNKSFLGHDPYQALHEQTALWLISREVGGRKQRPNAELLLRMGEVLQSCGAHGKVALVHSNCLLGAAQKNSLAIVKEFYSKAAGDKKTHILNPVCYDQALIDHIPPQYRFRGYGCGSPVLDAGISEGECVVDLGCGSGVECFIAARLSGRAGKVTGIDMLDPMLDLALRGKEEVEKSLGYGNLTFKKGFMEQLPLESDGADVVISNCVMNLSVNKRRAYGEIFRVLRPGGRLVISDVVCETEPDPAIRNDESLRGECIAGALSESHLTAILEETGFESVRLIKRFHYRTVRGHDFFSLTFSALRPRNSEQIKVMYRGPLPFLVTESGDLLLKGIAVPMERHRADSLGEQIFQLDGHGNAINAATDSNCCCCSPPEGTAPLTADPGIPKPPRPVKKTSGCMLCGAPLIYTIQEFEHTCSFCGTACLSNSSCRRGHYVCDRCHTKDATEAIRHICLHTGETDMIKLFQQVRLHPAFPTHGPEHHPLVAAVILTTYRNLGGEVEDQTILSGISRGLSIAGGACAFMGACGAAIGVGIGFSLLLQASPVKPTERSTVQTITQEVLKDIAGLKAARCCQRDGWIALKKCAELSKGLLSITLRAEHKLVCRQMNRNTECLGKTCPLHPQN
jgi:MoaA/NifB/PqqE/SkfB family radical SAM enzyme/SAM-dependent methyltransferase